MAKNPTTRHAMLAINATRLEHHPDPLDWLEQQTKTLQHIQNYAVILHDLDTGQDHYHVAITLSQPMRLNTIAKTYGQEPNVVEMWSGHTDNMWSYMTHQTKKAKAEKADYLPYLYDTTKSRWDSEDTQEKAKHKIRLNDKKEVELLAEKVITGAITKKDLLKHDMVMTYWKHKTLLDRALQLRGQSLTVDPPNCQTYYIQGKSGTGKTSYARNLADTLYPNDNAMASAGNDPLQDYLGEKCLIIDEFRPTDWQLPDLLSLLDPYHRKRTHKSRYYNKGLATEMILITSVVSLDDVITHYTAYTNEDPKQIRRRINKVIDLDITGTT